MISVFRLTKVKFYAAAVINQLANPEHLYYFVNLKSDSALKSNKGHNLLKSVLPSNNVK